MLEVLVGEHGVNQLHVHKEEGARNTIENGFNVRTYWGATAGSCTRSYTEEELYWGATAPTESRF